MKSKTVLVFLFSFGSAVTALAVSKPAPDVLFLPFNQQPSSQNVYADDGATRFWYYVGASLLSVADTQTRINSAAGKFGGTYAFRGASAAGTAMKSIGGTSGTGMGGATFENDLAAMTLALWLNCDAAAPAAISTVFCAYNGFYLKLDDGTSWGGTADPDGKSHVVFNEFNVIEYGWRSKDAVVPTNVWTHVAISVVRNEGWTMPTVYMNGVAIEMEANGTIGTPTRTAPASIAGKNVYVGNSLNTAAAGVYPFDGLISDIRLYSNVLTAEQVVMLTKSDAELNHAPPVVSLASTAQNGIVSNTVELVATAENSNPDPASVLTYRWFKASGPDAVWLDTPDEAACAASFSAVGEYVLGCVISDGVYATTNATLALAVETIGDKPHADIFFPFSADTPYSIDGKYYTYASYSAGFAGADSGYYADTRSMKCAGQAGSCMRMCYAEGGVAPLPANPDFISVAAWLDGLHMTNSADTAWIVGSYNGLDVSLFKGDEAYPADVGGKRYLRFSHGRTTSIPGMGAKTWGSVSPAVASNGWQHVAVCFCRTNGWNATPRVWVNGSEVEMAVVVNQTDGTLTALTNSACVVQFGNRFNTAAAGTEWFAGLISDVRFMFRELGGGEAKRLALGPPNHAPVIEKTGEMFFQTFNVKKMPVSVTDDGLPSGAALTYGWSALGDNASGVTFADSSALDTSVHFPGNGVYRLRLEASDGESASEEVFDVTVHVRGFLIQVR